LENFKKLQGNFKFHQNKCHLGDVPDMRRQCAKNIDQWAQGVADRPDPLAGRPCFMSMWPEASRTRVYMWSRRPRWWRKSVEAAPPGRPATTWHQTNFSKLLELPHSPINTPLWLENRRHTHHILEIPLVKLSFLV
jgi:hypothetical protein